MYKKILLYAAGIVLPLATYAQGSWLSPVTFPSNTGICDNTPYKLVYYDDFSNNQLDTVKWIRFSSWAGMPGGDNVNWVAGRRNGNGDNDNFTCINLDQNVVLSNGICQLRVKHEAANWHCDTCPNDASTKYYTNGTLSTPYNLPGSGNANAFNSGRFEFRLKQPVFEKAHTTGWTYFGAYDGVNEIDITESYGPKKSMLLGTYKDIFSPNHWDDYATFNRISVWAWPANTEDATPDPLPYHEGDDAAGPKGYPNPAAGYPKQTYYHWLTGNYHKINEWHKYRCDWDSTVIKFYMDDQLAYRIYKYYKWQTVNLQGWGSSATFQVQVASGCNVNGTNNISFGFPYRTQSYSNFRMTTYVDKMGQPTTGSEIVGQAEVDWVAIYQRHPEADNHTNLCAIPGGPPEISNPVYDFVNGYTTFTVDNPIPGAVWSGGQYMTLVASNISSATFTVDYPPFGTNPIYRQVFYDYPPDVPGCGETKTGKLFYPPNIPPPSGQDPIAAIDADMMTGRHQFLFARLDPSMDLGLHNNLGSYYWTFKYCTGTDSSNGHLTTYNSVGKYTLGPCITLPDNGKYYMEWELNIRIDSVDNKIKGIMKSSDPLYRQGNDSSRWYFRAQMKDMLAFLRSVDTAVRTTCVGPDADSIDIQSMVAQIMFDKIVPYLEFDTTRIKEIMDETQNRPASPGIAAELSGTKLYPNPANTVLNLTLADGYQKNKEQVTASISDLAGKHIIYLNISNGAQHSIDTGDLPPGIYVLTIRQGAAVERHKFVKE